MTGKSAWAGLPNRPNDWLCSGRRVMDAVAPLLSQSDCRHHRHGLAEIRWCETRFPTSYQLFRRSCSPAQLGLLFFPRWPRAEAARRMLSP